MRGKIWRYFVLICAIFCFGISCVNGSASASSYDTCIAYSGGRGGIESVQQACSYFNPYNSGNGCSLWLGSADSTGAGTTIYVNSASGTATIYYWGMCTLYENTTSNVWVSNANDSIGVIANITRGTWGSPNYAATTLDIGKFVSGASSWESSKGTVYYRNVGICRQHGGNSSTDCQDVSMYVVVRARTLSGLAIDESGNRLGDWWGRNPNSSTVNYGSSASISAKSLDGYDYDFLGWRTNWQASRVVSTSSTYTVSSLTSDTTVYAIYRRKPKTLSGISILDTDGSKIGSNPNPSTVSYNASASITRKNITGYDFQGWKASKTASGYLSRNATYTVSNLTSNTTVYAVYSEKIKEFSGYSKVSFSGTLTGDNDTGWQSSGNTTVSSVIACTSTYGKCALNFTHGAKRTSGESGGKDGSYTIDRATNSGWGAGTNSTSGTIGATEVTVSRNSVNIAVGTTVCDRNKFSTKVKWFSGEVSSARTQACVSAPYNYKNNFSVDVPDYVYSGESMNMQLKAWVEDLYNSELDKTFHTVGNATITWSIVSNGTTYDTVTKTLTNYISSNTMPTINAPDVRAGSTVCVVATLSPISSTDSGSISTSDCATVKKKPTVQVLGGGIYSAGGINTLLMNKKNVAGNSYSRTGTSATTFGSWDELAVTSNGYISGFASGAALSSYGILGSSICKYSSLTFANSSCSRLGNSGITRDGSSLVDNLFKAIEENPDGIDLRQTSEISSNIINPNYSSAKSLADLNQIVVYSDGDLNIKCGVTRIDAILIAKGTVNTCSDAGDENDEKRSNQLTINGSILASKLVLGRTYGAATGYTNSAIPAEIINAATSFYLWGAEKSEDSGQLYTSYIHELSPRY